jgi:predicted enzyme related to lactoylglutathione lyase
MKKVTGIGGVFFKCKDPNKVMEWYKTHLGLDTTPYGVSFECCENDDSTEKNAIKKSHTIQWSAFEEKTTYFEPSTKEFMINYRVEDLEKLMQELKNEGVIILDEIQTYSYGKFLHILDIEGNKIELWEPF